MTPQAFQQWLNAHGASLVVDGQIGLITRAAFQDMITNKAAPAASPDELAAYATRLGVSAKQLAAISKVESSGGGFTDDGRPKILFERHKFWALTDGRFPVTGWNNPQAGGYNEPSYPKLMAALSVDPGAAVQACSWGKFQIMGFHWQALGYATPMDMPYAMSRSEAAHYDALCRFLKANGLADDAARISRNPETNRGFAKGFNGAGYERFNYHVKLAEAMR